MSYAGPASSVLALMEAAPIATGGQRADRAAQYVLTFVERAAMRAAISTTKDVMELEDEQLAGNLALLEPGGGAEGLIHRTLTVHCDSED